MSVVAVDDVELFKAVVGQNESLVVFIAVRWFHVAYEACVVNLDKVEEVTEGLGGDGVHCVFGEEGLGVYFGEEVRYNSELLRLFIAFGGRFVICLVAADCAFYM